MKFIKFEVNNHICTVTLNRPPVNPICLKMYEEIIEAFSMINTMDEIRVAILRAEGKYFCVGNDLKDLDNNSRSDDNHKNYYVSVVTEALVSVYNCRVPLICAVQRMAVGAGLAIAACGDIIIASENSLFSIPEIKVGIIGASGFASLIAPEKVVRYMALTGNPISAEELNKYGTIYKIVPAEKLDETALEIANELLANPPLALRYFKEALNTNADAKLVKKYQTEAALSLEISNTHDRAEAIKAKLEKRVPKFIGK